MTDITQEMQKLIEANLPAATAGAMKDFIREAERKSDDLAESETQIKDLMGQISRLQTENAGINERLADQEELANRVRDVIDQEEKMAIRERDINLEVAKIKLMAANDRNTAIERLVEKAFGHPSLSVSTHRNRPIMHDPGPGCTPYQAGSVTEDETTTTTQSKV